MTAHLHVHSNFSLLEGLPSPQELAEAAAANGMPAIALTDHNSLSGAVEFTLACQSAGVQPIIGVELDVQLTDAGGTAYPLVFLIEGERGWPSLCRLTSQIYNLPEVNGKRPCPPSLLAQHTDGLLCLTGGSRSALYHLANTRQDAQAQGWLSHLADLFPGRLYVELQLMTGRDAAAASRLAEQAADMNLPLAAAHDIYLLTPSQADVQRTLTAARLNVILSELPPGSAAAPGAHFITPQELERRFAAFPQALAGTDEIVSRCNFRLPLGGTHFPQLDLPHGASALDVLRRKAYDGAARKYGVLTPAINQRLEHELAVIAEMSYEAIFLIVEELLQFARSQGILTASRGSAASSLVAYSLGITTPDPLAHNLYFERFLNPARATPPDIDTDLCSRRREEIIQHVFERYGTGRVAMVGTINRYRPRSALGDVAKAHGLSPSVIRALTSRLPYGFRLSQERDDTPGATPFDRLLEQHSDVRHRLIFQQANAVLGLPRHLSQHAGGIVIAPGEITNLVPVQPSGPKGVMITAMNLDSVEKIGLVKIDLLGIRGLTVLGDVASAIHSWRRLDYPNPLAVLEDIPTDDEPTAELVSAGRTIGCFQIESPGMRATLKSVAARSVEDIIRTLALYRPGPLKGGYRDVFIRRQRGLEPTAYLHPALEPILRESHGIVLYQEQVLRIASALGGLSLPEAELLRRAMTHFDPGKQMQELRSKFLAGAVDMSGIPLETAEKLWELMAAFAGYGFPKAHAASYALTAWRSAWCKAHFPAEFLAAVLANWGGYYSQRVYLNEARRLGLTVKPPHVNHSNNEFSVSYPGGEAVLYMGLDQVRDLTHRTINRIITHRPFHTFEAFLQQVDPRPQEAKNLAAVGGFSGLGSIPALIARLRQPGRARGQLSLFDAPTPETSEDWTLEQRINAQQELLEISIDAHPLELYADQLAKMAVVSTVDAAGMDGETVRVAGIRQSMRRSRTGRGEWMAFLSMEDMEGMLDVVIFPQTYQRFRGQLQDAAPLVIEGVMETAEGREEPYLRAERIWRLERQ